MIPVIRTKAEGCPKNQTLAAPAMMKSGRRGMRIAGIFTMQIGGGIHANTHTRSCEMPEFSPRWVRWVLTLARLPKQRNS